MLVTGSTGFVGRWLVEELLGKGAPVLGIARQAPIPPDTRYRIVQCDLTRDVDTLRHVISSSNPASVFHMVAATDQESTDLRAVVTAALHATENLLDACGDLPIRPRVVVVSSSAVYGDSEGKVLTERSRTAAVTMYGVSKILTEALAVRRRLSTGMAVMRARVFNVIGPGQQANRAVAAFARQIAEIEAGIGTPPIRTAGLSAWRDFIDVRDVASGLCAIMGRGKPGEVYNICSGRAVRVGMVLDRLLKMSRLDNVPIASTNDRGVSYQRGDRARLLTLGWHSRVPLKRSLQDILEDWRTRVAQ